MWHNMTNNKYFVWNFIIVFLLCIFPYKEESQEAIIYTNME